LEKLASNLLTCSPASGLKIRMAINFEYDLGEVVRLGQNKMPLRTAVRQYIDSPKALPIAPRWYRTQGKKPITFESNHMEQLAALPIFGKSPR
jgi:hypothetical protein